MPWEITKKGSQFCVVKEGGSTVACHATRDEALAHLKALYKNAGPEAQPKSAKVWEDQMAVVVEAARQSG